MIRRLLVVLALLLSVSDSWGKTLIVTRRVDPALGTDQDEIQGIVAGEFNVRGASWSQISATSTKTLWASLGQVPSGPGRVDQYDAVVHMNFWVGEGEGNYRPDSIGKVGKWPTVPQIFIGKPYSGATFVQSAGCSTGVNSPSAGFDVPRSYYSQYVVGKPYVWMRSLAFNSGLQRAAAAMPAGIWRPIVSMGPNQMVRPTGTNGIGGFNCVDCDSVGRSDMPDSVLLWVRYRSPVEPAPLIYVSLVGNFSNPFAGTYANEALLRIALAIADSASGGKVFDNPARTNFRRSIVVRRAFGRNRYSPNNNFPQAGGMFCYADSCDSVNVKAGIDSLESLSRDPLGISPGLKIGIGVNVDSIPSYPYELAWWRRLTKARFILDSNTYVGIASANLCVNPFGGLNTDAGGEKDRTLIPANTISLPTECGNDTSLYCLLVAGKKLMNYYFPGKVDPSVCPSGGDWTPPSMVAANSPGADSLDWAIYRAGFRTIIMGETPSYVNVNRHWVANAGGGLAGLMTTHHGWTMDTYARGIRKVPGYNQASPRIGTLTRVMLRQHSNATHLGYILDSHPVNEETLANLSDQSIGGREAGGYPDWRAGGDGLMFSVMELAGYGQNTIPRRRAWWQIKQAMNQSWAANSFMIPGKLLEEWVWPSELRPKHGVQ